MSTNINISVGDNKLLAQASLQQNASRQAQLEKEANKRLQSEAEINRVNALAAQGKDANGNPLTGTPFQAPQLERRPAANRFGGSDFLLLKPSAPINLDTYETPTEKNVGWPKYMLQSSSYAYPVMLFEANSGPNNSTSFVVNKRGTFDFAALFALHPSPENESKYRSQIKDVTLEMFMYFGNTLPLATPTSAQQASHTVIFSYGSGGYIRAEINTISDIAGYATSIVASIAEQQNTSPIYVANDVYASNMGNYNPNDLRLLAPWASSPLQGQTWYHLALVKKDRSLKFFINGVLYSELALGFDYILLRPNETIPGSFIQFQIEINALGAEASLGSKIHGYRLTPKALYSSNFTPPPNL